MTEVPNLQEYPLPENTSLFGNQIAGHFHGTGKLKLGMLKHNNGNLLKPLFRDDKRGKRELDFYQTLFVSGARDPVVEELLQFVPRFSGLWTGTIRGLEIEYLCLEDITAAFDKPCILEVKMGPQTYDPEASEQKMRQEKEKYPPVEIIGFRILGMRVYQHHQQKYLVMAADFGKQLTPETISSALRLFLEESKAVMVNVLLCALLHKLKNIEQWFLWQRQFAFYSSSLLLVYEGERSHWNRLKEMVTYDPAGPHNLCISKVVPEVADCNFNVCHLSQSVAASESPEAIQDGEVLIKRQGGCPIDFDQTSEVKNVDMCHKCKKTQKCLCDVRMIDFAHVFPTTEIDKNYLFGLQNLISYLQILQAEMTGA